LVVQWGEYLVVRKAVQRVGKSDSWASPWVVSMADQKVYNLALTMVALSGSLKVVKLAAWMAFLLVVSMAD
jgi:hypothetical protein